MMKKYFLPLLFFLLLTQSACSQNRKKPVDGGTNKSETSQGIHFQNITFEQALEKAKAENKPIFLDAYAVWCGPCKYMANTVFTKPEAGDWFNPRFINVKFDMEAGEGIELAQKFKVTAYPTFLILDSNARELGRIVGGDMLKPFIKKVEDILAEAGQTGI